MPAKKIMVIDDERDILKLVQAALKRYGHEVEIFSEPIDALEHFRQHHGDYSLLLVDIRMPGMSGFELFEKLKKRNENIKVCFLSAFETYDKKLASAFPDLDEVNCFLKKPIAMEELVKRLAAILNAG